MVLRLLVLFSLATTAAIAAEPKSASGPLSPREEMATFRTLPGFQVELVASEPDVVDPVAMAFDERGRIFVTEMRGYPNGGRGTGPITSGRIKCLTDRDGDGVYEDGTLFAEGLRFPTSVMPYRGGLLVANAPDLLYLEDTDEDGRSDRRRVLYTGFGIENIQQLLNSLQWGLDNWVHGCAGTNGGSITCPDRPDLPPVVLRSRHVRFHPDVPGSLEPTSGGGQYGLSQDDFGQWFTATNSQHLRHIVLPDHYLRRNPHLSVGSVTHDIPDHGAACKVFRISPFEAWRVERTTRRVGDPKFANWSPTEKVPGGFVTSGCSPIVYTADRFPLPFRGNTFVCDPANNLIHRDKLVPSGATFVATRADEGCEFLASTHNWFRPVQLNIGPDGGLYVLDFFREAIETPLSLPDDIKAKMNLESRGRGRIWRIVPTDRRKPNSFDLRSASSVELVAKLQDMNAWWRLTAQRLLIERRDKSIIPALETLLAANPEPHTRVHALRALEGLKSLGVNHVFMAFADAHARVREAGLMLSEPFLTGSDSLGLKALTTINDADARVRFQAALTIGGLDKASAVIGLSRLLQRDGADAWFQSAALSSAGNCAPELLTRLAGDAEFVVQSQGPKVLARLATMIGARGEVADLAHVLHIVGEPKLPQPWQSAVLEGLGQGLQNSKRPLRQLWESPPAELAETVKSVRPVFVRAAAVASASATSESERLASIRLLGFGPFDVAAQPLTVMLHPRQSVDLQMAAARALAANDHPRIAEILLSEWDGYSPSVRREVVEALTARPARVAKLLDAIEAKRVLPAQIEAARRDLLRKHPNVNLRRRATELFDSAGSADRQKVVDDHRLVLHMIGDAARGKALFQKHCGVCHKLDNVGQDVGPDLRAALGNKTRDALLVDVLDPNREVDPRYVNYVATTVSGRQFTGLLAAESTASVTLRRAEGAEDTILRGQIDSMQATGQSVMPDELEKQLSRQDLADVIEYLLPVRKPG